MENAGANFARLDHKKVIKQASNPIETHTNMWFYAFYVTLPIHPSISSFMEMGAR